MRIFHSNFISIIGGEVKDRGIKRTTPILIFRNPG